MNAKVQEIRVRFVLVLDDGREIGEAFVATKDSLAHHQGGVRELLHQSISACLSASCELARIECPK